jgi:integrase
MEESIRVHVVKYPDRDNLVLRYRDPITGKHVTKSAGTAKTSEATRAAGVWQDELRNGRYKAPSRMSWSEFREVFETEKVPTYRKESTVECKITALNHVERTINPQRMSDLTTQRLTRLSTMLRAEGMREGTIAAHLRNLKPVLGWAVTQGYLRTMPTIEMPEFDKAPRGRDLTTEEVERMIAKVPDVRKREPKKWKRLIQGLWLSGLRLGEALSLSWDDDAAIRVDMTGRYPALDIQGSAQKSGKDQLLPLAPEFCEFLSAVPLADRHGLVFGIYGPTGPLTTKRASRYIAAIGKAANVVTNKAMARWATAHDLRRSFAVRWSKRVFPPELQALMRHSSITTTLEFYVQQNCDTLGDRLRAAQGNNSGNTGDFATVSIDIEADTKAVTIRR